jgi:hypothetical protein
LNSAPALSFGVKPAPVHHSASPHRTFIGGPEVDWTIELVPAPKGVEPVVKLFSPSCGQQTTTLVVETMKLWGILMAMGGSRENDQDVLFLFERLDKKEGHRMAFFIPRQDFCRTFRKMIETYPVRCVGFDARQDDGAKRGLLRT